MSDHARRPVTRTDLRSVVVLTVCVVTLIIGSAWVLAVLSTQPAGRPAAEQAGLGANALPARSQPATSVGGGRSVGVSTSALIANFNLYGCTESAPSWPSCTARVPAQWTYINRYRLSIVGFQELEPGPYQLFRAKVDAAMSGWSMYPTHPEFVNQQTTGVLWRTDQWRLVRAQEFQIVKYTWRDSGGLRSLYAHEAAVLLRSRTGTELWVLSVHNMSGENVSFASGLAQDEEVESAEFAKRVATGVPVILLGDFNDDTAKAICAVMARTQSAHSIWGPVPAGDCADPSAVKGQPFDKIIGSADVVFTGSGIDWSTQSHKLTDHGIAWADVSIR